MLYSGFFIKLRNLQMGIYRVLSQIIFSPKNHTQILPTKTAICPNQTFYNIDFLYTTFNLDTPPNRKYLIVEFFD